MRLQKFVGLFLSVVLLMQSISAFETDQFNLPPKPLADIGVEVSEYVEQNLREAIEKINGEILAHESCLKDKAANATKTTCESADKERAKLKFLRSEDAPAQEVFDLLGAGMIPFTKSGTWMEKHQFRAQPARYKTSFSQSIFVVFPTDYLTISSTVKIYDAEFGTDKIAHFFQQGYSYYKIYKRAIDEGNAPDEAAQKAIRWGKTSERTFYGTLVSGVYSNADLCANYVGMKFYVNLTREIKIGDIAKPAVLQFRDGVWKFAENGELRDIIIKPFLSKHFNEALNSSIYSELFGLRSYVRQTVRKRSCKEWRKQFPNVSRADFSEISQKLRLWHGEDYGFTDSKHFVTISSLCFDGENAANDKSE